MKTKIQDMTSGSPGRLIILFAIPLMLGNICQQLYTMVDTMVCNFLMHNHTGQIQPNIFPLFVTFFSHCGKLWNCLLYTSIRLQLPGTELQGH